MDLIKFPLKLFFWTYVVAIILAFLFIGLSCGVQLYSGGELGLFVLSAIILSLSTISLALSHGIYVYFFIKYNIPLTILQNEQLNDNVYFGLRPGFGVLNVGSNLPEIVDRCGYRLNEKIALKAKTLSKRQKYLSTASAIFTCAMVFILLLASIA